MKSELYDMNVVELFCWW